MTAVHLMPGLNQESYPLCEEVRELVENHEMDTPTVVDDVHLYRKQFSKKSPHSLPQNTFIFFSWSDISSSA
jgi:hypothetical protein